MKQVLVIFFVLGMGVDLFSQTPVELADQQLEAYNNRDIEAFLEPYSETVKIYRNGKLAYEGKEKMRARYATMFENTPELHCKLLNRIALEDTVIDHEEVTGKGGIVYAIAMYKIKNNKIEEVRFEARKVVPE